MHTQIILVYFNDLIIHYYELVNGIFDFDYDFFRYLPFILLVIVIDYVLYSFYIFIYFFQNSMSKFIYIEYLNIIFWSKPNKLNQRKYLNDLTLQKCSTIRMYIRYIHFKIFFLSSRNRDKICVHAIFFWSSLPSLGGICIYINIKDIISTPPTRPLSISKIAIIIHLITQWPKFHHFSLMCLCLLVEH